MAQGKKSRKSKKEEQKAAQKKKTASKKTTAKKKLTRQNAPHARSKAARKSKTTKAARKLKTSKAGGTGFDKFKTGSKITWGDLPRALKHEKMGPNDDAVIKRAVDSQPRSGLGRKQYTELCARVRNMQGVETNGVRCGRAVKKQHEALSVRSPPANSVFSSCAAHSQALDHDNAFFDVFVGGARTGIMAGFASHLDMSQVPGTDDGSIAYVGDAIKVNGVSRHAVPELNDGDILRCVAFLSGDDGLRGVAFLLNGEEVVSKVRCRMDGPIYPIVRLAEGDSVQVVWPIFHDGRTFYPEPPDASTSELGSSSEVSTASTSSARTSTATSSSSPSSAASSSSPPPASSALSSSITSSSTAAVKRRKRSRGRSKARGSRKAARSSQKKKGKKKGSRPPPPAYTDLKF